jgi:hypothetical protein
VGNWLRRAMMKPELSAPMHKIINTANTHRFIH